MKDLAFNLAAHVGRMLPSTGIPVLLYHSVSTDNWPGATDPDQFEKQLHWIDSHYTVVSLRDVCLWTRGRKQLPGNALALTFDDGYRDNLAVAAPLMKRLKMKATLFTITGNKKIQSIHGPLLSEAQLETLVYSYGWEVHSHTVTHPDLRELSEKQLLKELSLSKKALQKLTSNKDIMLAYPKGKYNHLVIRQTHNVYKAAWTAVPRLVKKNDDLFMLPRIGISRETSLAQFKTYLTPLVDIISSLA